MSEMTPSRIRVQLRQLAVVAGVAAVLAAIFNLLTSAATVHEAIQGVVDALLISALVGTYVIVLRDGWLRGWLRRLSFRANLAVNSAIVIGLFLIGRALGQVLVTGQPGRFARSFTDAHLLYALPFFVVLVVLFNFLLQMNRVIGTNVLRYFVAGVYHRPKAEERVFLFVDLEGSTMLGERLGSARYFDLLRRFVDDVSGPILDARGDIYQYAGDEIVVTWDLATGVRSANCIRCFFGMRDRVAREASRYRREFGVVPAFRGGLHGGTVTAGELGDVRQQIVFVGDILNTAARLEEYAKRVGLDLVISRDLLERLVLPPGITATPCGELDLRGKEAPVAAYGLTARAVARV
jgi:adenylate cyclase